MNTFGDNKRNESPSLQIFFLAILILMAGELLAQTTVYKSNADDDLNIKDVLVLPAEDNVNGIYARPLTDFLRQAVDEDAQWNLKEVKDLTRFNLATIYTRSEDVKKILKESDAQALIKMKLSKGPGGINAKLTLFTQEQGYPLVESTLENYQGFELQQMKTETLHLLYQIKNKLPFRGLVLSRKGLEITVNLGRSSGIKQDSDISLVQILKLNRHPKHRFVIGSEKEILGKARVFKVDDELSFATLLMEREPGVVSVGTKVLPDEYVKYPEPFLTEDGRLLTKFNERQDKDVSYGAKPTEWLPLSPPQYGRIAGLLGFSQYTQTQGFDVLGSKSASNNLAPTLQLESELWLNKDWFLLLDLRQSSFSVQNEVSGSTPTKINMTLSKYHIGGGKNFILGEDFFGSKIQITGGFAKFSSSADSTSPTFFTNVDFGGMVFGFLGQLSLDTQKPMDIGLKYKYFWNPKVNESKSSGSPGDVKITDFGLFYRYAAQPRFSYLADLDFEYYSSNFSGGGDRSFTVSSAGHKNTTLLFGVEFLF